MTRRWNPLMFYILLVQTYSYIDYKHEDISDYNDANPVISTGNCTLPMITWFFKMVAIFIIFKHL